VNRNQLNLVSTLILLLSTLGCHRYRSNHPPKLLPHPNAVANTHAPGEVDRPELVRFVVPHSISLPGIVLDETDAVLEGLWQYSTHTPPYVGIGYLHDQNTGKGKKSVTYYPTISKTGWFELRLSHCYNIRRSTNTLVEVKHKTGIDRMRINQQQIPEHNKLFRSIGTYQFANDKDQWVRISNEGTEGKYVIADAIQLLRVSENSSR
jgi:hypothetical protein